MPKQKEIPRSLREQAIGLFKGGSSITKISQILQINCSTLHYIIRKWKSIKTTKNLPRQGRPRLLSARGKRQLKSIVKRNRTSNLRCLTRLFNKGKPKNVSGKTISRNLHAMGFWARRACKKPLVSTANQKKRLAFYNKCKSWGPSDWKNVIFSDESKFNLIGSDGRKRVWRQKNERYLPECTQKTVVGGGGSVMLWGCITYEKLGPLIQVNGRLTSLTYISDILEPLLQFWRVFRRRKKEAYYMQDNAPIHKGKSVMEWFGKKKVRV